jgi:hypothetical protein
MSVQAIINRVRASINGCPDFVIETELLYTLREFCDFTHVWTDDVSLFIPPETRLVPITLRYPADIIAIVKASYPDGDEIDRRCYSLDYDNNIIFETVLSGNGINIIVRVALKPVQLDDYVRSDGYIDGANLNIFAVNGQRAIQHLKAVPDFIFRDYVEILVHGVLGRLFEMRNTPWFDGRLSQYHLEKFRDSLGKPRIDMLKGRTNRSLRVQPRSFV